MVAGKDKPEPPPQKKSGIEVVMWPLNPDGSWKDGSGPPKLVPPQKTGSRGRDRRSWFEEQAFSRLRAMTSQIKDVRIDAARQALRKITITRRVTGEGQFELGSNASENASVVIEPADLDEDSDSYENIIFIQEYD